MIMHTTITQLLDPWNTHVHGNEIKCLCLADFYSSEKLIEIKSHIDLGAKGGMCSFLSILIFAPASTKRARLSSWISIVSVVTAFSKRDETSISSRIYILTLNKIFFGRLAASLEKYQRSWSENCIHKNSFPNVFVKNSKPSINQELFKITA